MCLPSKKSVYVAGENRISCVNSLFSEYITIIHFSRCKSLVQYHVHLTGYYSLFNSRIKGWTGNVKVVIENKQHSMESTQCFSPFLRSNNTLLRLKSSRAGCLQTRKLIFHVCPCNQTQDIFSNQYQHKTKIFKNCHQSVTPVKSENR